jgi:hypothetical protein
MFFSICNVKYHMSLCFMFLGMLQYNREHCDISPELRDIPWAAGFPKKARENNRSIIISHVE